MAHGGLSKRMRRWRRRRREQAPSPWAGRLSAFGIGLLVLGAVLVAIYVSRLR